MAIIPVKLLNDIDKIISTTTQKYREELDKNIHVVDISYGALKVSDPKMSQEEYAELIDTISKEYKLRPSLKAVMSIIRDPDCVRGFTALVEDPAFGTYIVAKNYSSLQNKLAGILKKMASSSVFTGVDVLGKTTTNIGHIPSKVVASASSPLSEKLRKLVRVTIKADGGKAAIAELNQLFKAHEYDLTYSFTRPNFNIRAFNNILGTGSVLVTLHSAEKNNELSKEEKTISSRISAHLQSKEFVSNIINTPGSNTILEDIRDGLRAALQGKSFNSLHSKKPDTAVKKKPNTSGRAILAKVPPLVRNLQGQFYSLTSLQTLINTHLQDVISANMGDGGETRILNYRTGRFAASAQVERLSQSRAGAITAFYAYMKYPYQTFEQGYAQGSPISKDPRLLISKSIREIAATKVSNALRAVSI